MPQCVGLSCRFSGRATIRGELALKRKHIIAAKAKKNQIRKPKSVPQNSVEQKIDTQKELAKIAGVSHDTIARVHESGRCTLPFRGGNIEGRPAGGGPGFSRDGRHVSGYGPGSGRAARAVRGRCGRLRAALWRLRDALPGSTGNGFVSGALSHRDTPAILASSFLVSIFSIIVSEF